ncbi:hypothetical protein CPB86DRAFT_822398 [Serendipita vermifera]|nr:hypothetical protein CPB86DRAFT_822398 [Serendipita vermifera]
MPPRGRGGRRPSRTSTGKAADLMLPPPAPTAVAQASQATSTETRGQEKGNDSFLDQKLLGPEVKALRECLIESATTMAQLVNHHADIHKIGVQNQLPYPPKGLREAWLSQSERYEELIEIMEIQVRRALDAVEYQIEAEKEKMKLKKQAEEMQKAGNINKGRKPSSMVIDIPRFDKTSIDPLTIHPDFQIRESVEAENGDVTMVDDSELTDEPSSILESTQEGTGAKLAPGHVPSGAAVPKDPGISRGSRSSISLTSLNRGGNRHGLKLDLSNLTMEGLAEGKSAIVASRISAMGPAGLSGIEPIASPVTLAPKSARPRPGFDGEFPPLGLDDPLESLLKDPLNNMQVPTSNIAGGIDASGSNIDGLVIDDLFGDSEMNYTADTDAAAVIGSNNDRNASNAPGNTMESLFSTSNFLPEVKAEDVSVDMLAGTTAPEESSTKLLEQLGFQNESTDILSTAPATDLNLETFDFGINSSMNQNSNTASSNAELDLMRLQQAQQQLQQRQQFGLGLGLSEELTSSLMGTDVNEAVRNAALTNPLLDQYRRMFASNPTGNSQATDQSNDQNSTTAGGATDFSFELFGNSGESINSSGGDGTLNFNSLFNQMSNEEGKTN